MPIAVVIQEQEHCVAVLHHIVLLMPVALGISVLYSVGKPRNLNLSVAERLWKWTFIIIWEGIR